MLLGHNSPETTMIYVNVSNKGLAYDFTQQINRSIMAENHILTEKLHATNKLLTDLYEEINGNYIETLERNDELAIACADAQLKLIKEIIDKMEEI